MVPRPENFPWNKDSDQRIAKARQIIDRFPDRISYSPRLPNADVIRIFDNCHVAALPSFHDTFGYSVLEAQSHLCPVITTNQRAFPEINPEQAGWTIDLPIDRLGQVRYRIADFAELSRKLYSGVLATLTRIIDGRMASIYDKAEGGFRRLGTCNDPNRAEDAVYKFY
jgi:glycosyltransferase involved in cell wall biosynthesis